MSTTLITKWCWQSYRMQKKYCAQIWAYTVLKNDLYKWQLFSNQNREKKNKIEHLKLEAALCCSLVVKTRPTRTSPALWVKRKAKRKMQAFFPRIPVTFLSYRLIKFHSFKDYYKGKNDELQHIGIRISLLIDFTYIRDRVTAMLRLEILQSQYLLKAEQTVQGRDSFLHTSLAYDSEAIFPVSQIFLPI